MAQTSEVLGTDPTLSTTAPVVAPAAETEDEKELGKELARIEADSERLAGEGVFSQTDLHTQKAEVERTRSYFRDLPREERNRILRDRREFARKLVTRQLSGASVVPVELTLNHTRMGPLFELCWPYINRMSLNLERFGRETFGRDETGAVKDWFEKTLLKLEEYVDEQLRVAHAFAEKRETEMKAAGEMVFRPSIPRAAMQVNVEAYTRYAMRVLSVIIKFDQTMDHFDFMVWNGIRDQADVDTEVVRFLRMIQPLSVRGYTTHVRLMRTINDIRH